MKNQEWFKVLPQSFEKIVKVSLVVVSFYTGVLFPYIVLGIL